MTLKDKRDWIEALRNGRRQQSRDGLRDVSGFCCLGVLCDVKDHDGWREANSHYYNHNGQCTFESELLKSLLPGYDQRQALADKNDAGQSFYEISLWIEDNVEVDE